MTYRMAFILLFIFISGCSNTTVIHNQTDINILASQLCGDDFINDALYNPEYKPAKREYLIHLHSSCITSLSQAMANNIPR